MSNRIKIRILLFGLPRDLVGTGQLDLNVNDPSSVSEALSLLEGTYPSLRNATLLHAVNENYVEGNSVLKHGDELAIFTAVSGG